MPEQQPLLPSRSISYNQEVNADPEVSDKPLRWKDRTAEVLESPALHKTVITLVLIDSACVLADLGYTFLSETCTPSEGPNAPIWLTALAHISLAINTLFLIEIPLAIWAFGVRYYNPLGGVLHAPLHLFDAVVILTTFILEVVLKGRESQLASLLVVLRLWRLVKLVQGIAVGAGELEEENAMILAETRKELEDLIVTLAEVREENQKLRARLTWLENRGTHNTERIS
ncbi:hypothetical protein AcW1_005796 [Taiwanofungus camphoratus]|nr:hypothetical protein AcW1_005796 [Antrodia cinnamomea]